MTLRRVYTMCHVWERQRRHEYIRFGHNAAPTGHVHDGRRGSATRVCVRGTLLYVHNVSLAQEACLSPACNARVNLPEVSFAAKHGKCPHSRTTYVPDMLPIGRTICFRPNLSIKAASGNISMLVAVMLFCDRYPICCLLK